MELEDQMGLFLSLREEAKAWLRGNRRFLLPTTVLLTAYRGLLIIKTHMRKVVTEYIIQMHLFHGDRKSLIYPMTPLMVETLPMHIQLNMDSSQASFMCLSVPWQE